MNLNTLKNYIKGLPNPRTLSASDPNLPAEMVAFLKRIPGETVSIDIPNANIRIRSKVLKLNGPSTGQWPIQGMGNLMLTCSIFNLTIDNNTAKPKFDAVAEATLDLSPTQSIDTTVSFLHQEEEPWKIQLVDDLSATKAMDLLLLGKTGPLPFEIPSALVGLDHAVTAPKDLFQIIFYPNTSFEAQYTIGFDIPTAKWNLVKNVLSLKGLTVKSFILSRSFTTVLIGHFDLKGIGMDVEVALDNWAYFTAKIKPTTGNTFPSLLDFAKWIADQDHADEVVDSFKGPQFDMAGFDAAIAAISLSFDTANKKLDYLKIKSVISIKQLQLDIELSLPNIEISGHLHNNTPLKLHDFLSDFNIPLDNVPSDFKITTADFDAQLKYQIYSIALAVDTNWTVGPLTFESVWCSFNYSGSDYSAVFGCRLDFSSKIALEFSVRHESKDLGWVFGGSKVSEEDFDIGDVLAELGSQFGISNIPPIIKDMSLSILGISCAPKSNTYTFECAGHTEFHDHPIEVAFAIEIKKTQAGDTADPNVQVGNKGFSALFKATIKIDSYQFDGRINVETGGITQLVVAYHSTAKHPVKIHDLVSLLSTDFGDVIPSSLEVEIKSLLLLYFSTPKTTGFGFELGASVNLSELPLVGKMFSKAQTLSVDELKFFFSSDKIAKAKISELDSKQLFPEGVSVPRNMDLNKGLNFYGQVNMGGTPRVIDISVEQEDDSNTTPSNTPAAPPDHTKWFNIQKGFGPVYFSQVGVQYDQGTLWFLLRASLGMGGLTISLDGLGVGSPLDHFEPQFQLNGLGIDFKKGPLEIGGAFLKYGEHEYDGMAIIKTATLSLSAIGMYTDLGEHKSLFLYAILDYPLGGPPFFFVTGLALGFGYNRALKVPPIDQIEHFPLVTEAIKGAAPLPAAGGTQEARTSLTEKLNTLRQYIPPEVGQYFLAIGIKFTSFKLIDSFALLSVSFGHHFEIDILGISTVVAPPAEAGKTIDPLAKVQMAFSVRFIPDEGALLVDARLTSASFILSKKCHLQGGFAFYSWFSGPHAGDFVQTLGGYHPDYKKPDHYPSVPRLGFNWQVTPQLTLKGDAYYALTSTALMAGGHLEATYKDGNLKAWFKAGADFLIAWKPYHYDAKIYVNVGASYDTFLGTISVDLGADLHIWGPEFAGVAKIDLFVTTITVSFGKDTPAPKPISWQNFQTSFLPPDDAVLSIALTEGLMRTPTKEEKVDWVVNPKHFSFSTNSIVPSNSYNINGSIIAEDKTFGIAPMHVAAKELTSQHSIFITNEAGTSINDHFDILPIRKRFPSGLWGHDFKPKLNGKQYIEDTLSGFSITIKKQEDDPDETEVIERKRFQYSTDTMPPLVWHTTKRFKAKFVNNPSRRKTLIKQAAGVSKRNKILKALGFSASEVELKNTLGDSFLATPQVGTLV